MLAVSLIAPLHADQVWSKIYEGFQKASDRSGGDLTVADLWIGCRSGNCFLFIVHDGPEVRAASIWKPELWRSGQKFRCLALYGEGMGDWLARLHQQVAETAKLAGCTSLLADGREGWAKVFPGARKLRTTYEVPI